MQRTLIVKVKKSMQMRTCCRLEKYIFYVYHYFIFSWAKLLFWLLCTRSFGLSIFTAHSRIWICESSRRFWLRIRDCRQSAKSVCLWFVNPSEPVRKPIYSERRIRTKTGSYLQMQTRGFCRFGSPLSQFLKPRNAQENTRFERTDHHKILLI